MHELPQWFHELATMVTLAVAAVWLMLRWLRVGSPRGQELGCARCERVGLATQPAPVGVRSKRLRVIGQQTR